MKESLYACRSQFRFRYHGDASGHAWMTLLGISTKHGSYWQTSKTLRASRWRKYAHWRSGFVDCTRWQSTSLIDDATNEAELLAAYLRHVGIQVAMSSDGDAALSLLDCIDRKPGIILLDMVMPGRSGHSKLRALRENPEYGGIKIFAVTGLPQELLPSTSGLSVDRWFQKPIKPQQLASQIQQDLAVPA